MGADKGKKLKVADKNDEESAEQVDAELVVSIEKLQEIQDELEKINEKASDEVLEVEQKYNEIRKPVYGKRNEIINAIPDFWLTAIMSHPVLGELLTEEDQKKPQRPILEVLPRFPATTFSTLPYPSANICIRAVFLTKIRVVSCRPGYHDNIFKYLTSLEVEDSKDVKSGYSITFIFKSNPYFEDKNLTKAFTFLDEGTTKVTATSIKWKEGSDILSNTINHKKGNKRDLVEESFFTWFSNSHVKENLLDTSDDVAEIIKEDLWPNPLSYFNNEADDGEDSEEGDPEEVSGRYKIKNQFSLSKTEEPMDGESSEDDDEEDAEDGEK
ncbi:hypothetical protein V2J09_006246 [Rumex salicifolius]